MNNEYSCTGMVAYGCIPDNQFIERMEDGTTTNCNHDTSFFPPRGTWSSNPFPGPIKECYCSDAGSCAFAKYSATGTTADVFLINPLVQSTAGLTVNTDVSY